MLLERFIFNFYSIYKYVPASLFVHCVSAGACEGQKRVSDPLEPELGVGELPSVGAGN